MRQTPHKVPCQHNWQNQNNCAKEGGPGCGRREQNCTIHHWETHVFKSDHTKPKLTRITQTFSKLDSLPKNCPSESSTFSLRFITSHTSHKTSSKLVPSICLEGDEDKVSTRCSGFAWTLNLLHGYHMVVKTNSRGSAYIAPSDLLNKTVDKANTWLGEFSLNLERNECHHKWLIAKTEREKQRKKQSEPFF